MPTLRKFLIPAILALLGLVAGFIGRPMLDDNLVSAEFLMSEESPVVVIPKEVLGEFLQYVQSLEGAVSQCTASKRV